MKTNTTVVLILAFFSLIAGYLLSAISFVGRTGINLFYKEYKFLKTWWKGALIVFIVWLALLLIQSIVNRKANKSTAKMVNVALLIIAFAGLYFSYSDFRNTLSHRWLGERFHLGVYIFWLGWIGISIYKMVENRNNQLQANALGLGEMENVN